MGVRTSGQLWLTELLATARKIKNQGYVPVYFDVGARDGLPEPWEMLAKLELIIAVGFEPDEAHCVVLQNRDSHVKYLPFALGSATDKKKLFMTRDLGCSSLRKPNMGLLSKKYPRAAQMCEIITESSVRVTTLMEVLRKENLEPPDFIKIDTQGTEMEVLMGAQDILGSVKALELEAHLKPMYEDQYLLPDIKYFLEEAGHVLREIEVNGHFYGELLEVNAYFSLDPKSELDKDLLKLWKHATEIKAPGFLCN